MMTRAERLDAAQRGIRDVERFVYHELGDEMAPERRAEIDRIQRLAVGLRRLLNKER